jgi:hypothetical protein
MALLPFMTRRRADEPAPTGLRRYLRAAFRNPWNLLLFFGGSALAVMSPYPDAIMPILMGAELTYLIGLSSIPKFRTAIDAQEAMKTRQASGVAARVTPDESLARMIEGLPTAALRRFLALRQRCFEMRDIASGVRAPSSVEIDTGDSIRTPALDRLLFLFLKLLSSQAGLQRFLTSTNEGELKARVDDVRSRLTLSQQGGDERVVRSLQDSLADAELRLENYRKSAKDAEFVAIELDRIENKIQALAEMAVSRQDPEALSTQVTAAAESMQATEQTVNQLQHLSGLAAQIEEPPAILEADISKVFVRGTAGGGRNG